MNAEKVPATAPTAANAPSPAFAGVDVSKATLEAHVRVPIFSRSTASKRVLSDGGLLLQA